METDNNTLDAFIDRLLTEKQFANLDAEVREQLKKDLTMRAEDFINVALISSLSEADQTTFETMMDENKSAEELQAFLAAHVPDMNQVVAGALLKFRNIYINA